MSEEILSKEQLLQEFANAYEQVIDTATDAARRGSVPKESTWGPRETVAHLAGWEIMSTEWLPHIVAGMAPLDDEEGNRQTVMNDAINAMIVTMIGDQSLETVCNMLRQAYQRNLEQLRKFDDTFYQPGNYAYDRTKDVLEHCQEHIEILAPVRPV